MPLLTFSIFHSANFCINLKNFFTQMGVIAPNINVHNDKFKILLPFSYHLSQLMTVYVKQIT